MKNLALKVISPILLLLVLFQLVTALLRGSFYDFFHTWHPVAGAGLALFLLIHLAMIWKWGYGTGKGKDKPL